ncbi:sugar transferase [Metabacillus arenae]|uniref:Sugar transferase n=1 Tax=Metabacillus arenae TaxID=2771434 RepID=A0A926NS88_9BACI|nr:sugar transferase [Metabacillus arenae]MBD1383007.1 sugar transferase [Metabacillus arenae]
MPELTIRRRNKFIFLGIDLFILFLSYPLAFFLRFDDLPKRNMDSFISLLPWILLIGLIFLSVYELYNLQRRNKWDVVRDILVANTFIVFITMAFSFIFREFALPRSIIVISFGISIFLMLVWKLTFIWFRKGKNVDRVLLFGPKKDLSKLVKELRGAFSTNIEITCINTESSIKDNIDQLIKNADKVAIAPNVSEAIKTKVIYESISKNRTVFVVPSAYELILSKSYITSFDDSMVLAVRPFGLTLDQQIVKRMFDLVLGCISLLLLSPLFLLTIILIKLEDPKGSIFYGQKRLGRYNKEFTVLKFRTMIEDAEKNTGPVLASSDDKRITKIGKFLRLTRIDELPQFINVINGDMSIVGPRPEREHFIKQFEKQHETYKYRSTVKPGITGVAQVMGKYTTGVEDKLRYDLYYIRNYSIFLDILLLLRTVIVVLDKSKSEGAKKTKKSRKEIRDGITF